MDTKFFSDAMNAVGLQVTVIDENTDFSKLEIEDIRETNPHAALWASENYESPIDREWSRWVRQVEKLIGHSLDGNQDRDGYSLDYAYGCWEAGDPAEQHAILVRLNEASTEAAFGPLVA